MSNSYLVEPSTIGLKVHQYQLIEDIVLSHAQVRHAHIFGSRALGTYKDNSDIDIVLEGEGVTLDVISSLQDRLEQSSLPFKVDLLVKHRITSSELLEHIERYGITIK